MSGYDNYEMSGTYHQQSSARGGAPMQPSEAYNALQSSQYQNYVRAPPRRPVAPYARQPAAAPSPQDYQREGEPQPYAAYRPQPPAHSEQRRYEATAAGGEFGADAGDLSQSRSWDREPQPARNDAAYYGHHDDYHQRQDPFAQPHYSESPFADSQDSISPVHTPRGAMSAADSVGYGYGNDQLMPGGRQPYRGDGYDEFMDPRNIADDGDDAFEAPDRRPKSRFAMGGAGAAAGGAAAGGAGVLRNFGGRDTSGSYGPVDTANPAEKSEWLKDQSSRRKKLRWIVGILIAVIIVGGIAGGVAYYFLSRSSASSSGPPRGSASDSNGLWDINSPEVQAVLNNKNLHKVFPGMDYTPLNAQYPACLSNMPYQNDVTLDVAVLAQMTPAIRLYGTDCLQTEMVLKGIDLLGYNDTVKVWLGVWLADNSTTNTRQLTQMYDILDTYPSDHFAGVIVGNEVLFREDMTITQLASQLTNVRSELASRNINLPVATSDLGDDWTAALAADSDIVMSNVHPFFAGVTPDQASGWTWEFWQTHDAILKTTSGGPWPANVISETGWPTQGGNDCGTGAKCPTSTEGAIAGIDELNTFMDGWVCQSMANGTTYFWFEAFDEPWKTIFNDPTTGDFWEPHWGLMDVNRNLKKGVTIPDCGGKTVETPY